MNDMPSGLGHNRPPETLADELAVEFKDDVFEAGALIAAGETAPERIDDDETQNKAAELTKKLRALELKFDKARDDKKAPHAENITAINGFFKTHMEALERIRLKIKKASTDYLDRKAAAEKLRLKAEQDAREAAAAKALALAKDAEDTKNSAARQADDARILAQEAAAAKAAASTEQEQAAAELAQAKADHAAVKAAMLAVAAGYANDAKDGKAVSDEEKATSRATFDKQLAEARQKIDEANAKLQAARDKAIAARDEQRRQEEAARVAQAAAKTASREADASLTEAVRETKAADKIAAKIDGPDADLARTRSLHGAVSTLQRNWVCRVTDYNLLDRDALWPFIHRDAIDAALWKLMQTLPIERRTMPGAVMEVETTGAVR